MYRNILVPIDESAAAERGLEEAIRLASATGAKIRLVHVVNELSGVPSDLPGVDFRSIVEDLTRSGRTLLTRAEERVRAAGIDADTQLVETWGGRAGKQAVELAKDWPADLIVCGTHGRRGVRRMVMGSDAEYIARHSPVPVLLVRSSTVPNAEASLG